MEEIKYIWLSFWRYLLILFIAWLVFGCKAKEKTTERIKISDTLIRTSLTYKTAPIKSEYTINLECDTITGKVKPVNFKETSGDNSAKLKIENNQLKALLEIAEIESKTDTIYKTQFKHVYKDREVVRYKTPFWHWWAHLVAFIVLALYIRTFKPFKRFF